MLKMFEWEVLNANGVVLPSFVEKIVLFCVLYTLVIGIGKMVRVFVI